MFAVSIVCPKFGGSGTLGSYIDTCAPTWKTNRMNQIIISEVLHSFAVVIICIKLY